MKAFDDAREERVTSITTTEAAYKEQMKLRAPVDYWQAKAGRHKAALWWSRLVLILYTNVGSALLISALYWLTTTAVDLADRTKADTAIFIKYAAIGAILTTIGFWVGRVLLRIYLSDRHLFTDAEERVAMTQTYLALTHEGQLEPGDRPLVLAPLFRSASDGIVKNDGPDSSAAGLLAKLIDIKK